MSTPNSTVVVEETGPVRGLAFFLNLIAGILLMGLMAITFVDVLGRYIFNKPLTGSAELTQVTLCLTIFAVLPVIAWRNEQVVVDIFDSYFSPRLDLIRTLFFHLLGAIALGFLGQRLWLLGERSLSHHEITEFLHIPVGWPIQFIAGMCWFTALTLITIGVRYAFKRYKQQLAIIAAKTPEQVSPL